MFFLNRQTLKKTLCYSVSIVVFWNIVIAFRAYNFSHFKTAKNAAVQQAGIFDYALQRVTGSATYKVPVTTTPDVPFQNVTLTTASGLKLSGWYLPTANAKGSVAMFHGFAGNRTQNIDEAKALQQKGYNILMIDFRAHGNSEGTTTTAGLREAEDVKLCYDYLQSKGEKNIILYGSSMGAATISSCLATYNDVQPSKVVLNMPFENYKLLTEAFYRNSKYPKSPTFTMLTFWSSVINGEWFFDMQPAQYVKSIKCPVLLQWGVYDEWVSLNSTNTIFNNLKTDKTFAMYKKSGHESFLYSEPTEWHKNIDAFLAK
jgi:uncharacterized protein